MKWLPLLVFWSLWFLNFSSRTVLSPILPLMEDSLTLSHGAAGGFFTSLSLDLHHFSWRALLLFLATLSLSFFPVGLAAISRLTDLSDRSMVTGMALSIGVAVGMGGAPFILGVIADHSSFQAGILGLGLLTVLSSQGVRYLEET